MSSIKNLHLNLGEFSLDVPELELPDSGVTAIVGESGSGKTTFLKTLIGFYKPQGWSWQFRGEDLASMPVEDRRLGVVFQSYELFPHLSAAENVGLVMRSRYSRERLQLLQGELHEYRSLLNLDACWERKAELLSGGEKQRVALLRALFSNPRALLLDEPFSALNSELRAEARTLVKKLIQKIQIPVFLVTHDQQDVAALAEQSLNLKSGKFLKSRVLSF